MAMDSSKIKALLLILVLSISSTPLTLACGSCPTPTPGTPGGPILPPILPPIIGKPPITLPPIIGKPPITLPPIIGKPPITLPIIGKPITIPPITIPPIIGGTPATTVKPGCSPPPQTCPVDVLKLGACISCLGNEVHLGDPAVQCCPLIGGLAGAAAAVCLCTTIKANLLDINVYLPLALKLLVTCGNPVPPGYTCAN